MGRHYVASGNVSYFGDFRGHVEVSNPSQGPGGTFKIKAETGATGAWSFLAAAADPAVRLVGVGQGDGQLVKWGAHPTHHCGQTRLLPEREFLGSGQSQIADDCHPVATDGRNSARLTFS